ncbi:protein phosphatase 2 regulatory subunit B, partial [Pavlovales sp. CCMP2436]
LVKTVVEHHPGLAFLAATPEFQDRYVETAMLRILYSIARNGAPAISRSALERSDLPAALAVLDTEEDINKSVAFFSYEHFYVIYCKFWELDDDHDMLLSRDDLSRYADYSLSSRVVERIFHEEAAGAGKEAEARMTYPHFVWFVMSEEDKSSRVALEYWFRRVDLDGDGYISGFEIEFFYTEQLHRMRCMGQEPVELPDIICQLFDLVKPPDPRRGISLRDLLRCALGGKLFDVLFNLNKFLAWEAKDPHSIREERAQPRVSEWERFCKREYMRLALEDE